MRVHPMVAMAQAKGRARGRGHAVMKAAAKPKARARGVLHRRAGGVDAVPAPRLRELCVERSTGGSGGSGRRAPSL